MPISDRFTFSKAERLKNKHRIGAVFKRGKSVFVYPYRAVYLEMPAVTPAPVQVGISVPRRLVPKAHQRNKIKRQIRDVYRLQKHELQVAVDQHYQVKDTTTNRTQLLIMLIYVSKKKLEHDYLARKLLQCLQHFVKMYKI